MGRPAGRVWGFGIWRKPANRREGGQYRLLRFTRNLQGQTKTLWIGKQDFLIHQLRTVTSAEALSAAAKWDPEIMSALHGFTSIETHTNIVVNKQFLRSDFVP